MNKIKSNKILSLILITLIYLIAIIGGYFSSIWINNIYLQFFFADVITTIIVWVFSVILKNSSVYDAYWSLIPWVIFAYFIISYMRFDVFTLITYIVFSVWSFRLTINWIITFDNLYWEDWRYKNYRNNLNSFFFHIANFFGIQMMPTILVYGALLPLLVIIVNGYSSPLMLIGAGIILVGTILEFISDHQMHKFLKEVKEKRTCNFGLWKYSRHPNYLGEILIWVGSFICLIVNNFEYWYLCYGFITMILLFEFISIPMAEKRHKARRSDYFDYIKVTSRLLILPNRKK